MNVLAAHNRDARWATQRVDDSVVGERHSPFFERLQSRDLVEQFPIQIIGQDHHHVAERRRSHLIDGRIGVGQNIRYESVNSGIARGCSGGGRNGGTGGVLADAEYADGDGCDGGDAGDGDGVSTPSRGPVIVGRHGASSVRTRVSRIRRTRKIGRIANAAPAANAQS